jgi:phosphatidylserine decarboxylase
MRIPLSKYGLPQVIVYPSIILGVMAIVAVAWGRFPQSWMPASLEMILALLLVLSLMFFRDPDRAGPQDPAIVLAPADGRVTDIQIVDEGKFIGGPAVKIGIFLSIFNTHINRSPCNVTVDNTAYKKGKYRNAANPLSSQVNESNDLSLVRTDNPREKLLVRQISGAIARRIVCTAKPGQVLAAGERFGMIKFGSRTELYAPQTDSIKCLVQVGDKVKAGLTPVLRYEKCAR